MFRQIRLSPWAQLVAIVALIWMLALIIFPVSLAQNVVDVVVYLSAFSAFLGVLCWAARDARQVGRELRDQRRELALPVGKPRPDGDLTEVVGLQPRVSWLPS